LPHEAVQRGRSPGQHHGVEHNVAPVYVVEAEKKQVFVKFGKRLNVADVEKYFATLVADPAFQADFSELVDLTEVEQLNLEAEDFLRLADQVDPFLPHAKRAFVVRTALQDNAARMHKVLRTHQTVEIFRSREEAERWIRG
jgi:hypothetical protein